MANGNKAQRTKRIWRKDCGALAGGRESALKLPNKMNGTLSSNYHCRPHMCVRDMMRVEPSNYRVHARRSFYMGFILSVNIIHDRICVSPGTTTCKRARREAGRRRRTSQLRSLAIWCGVLAEMRWHSNSVNQNAPWWMRSHIVCGDNRSRRRRGEWSSRLHYIQHVSHVVVVVVVVRRASHSILRMEGWQDTVAVFWDA